MRTLIARSGLRRRLAVVAGLMAIITGGTVLAAVPASAAPYCSSGYHCVFWLRIGSAKHSYFNSDSNFGNDKFSNGVTVNNNVWAASNSSNSGYESHYYDGTNYSGFLFCVNPGSYVSELPNSLKDRASSMRLRGTTSIHCY